MNGIAMSAGRAQVLLGRVVGLAVVIALYVGLIAVLKGDVDSLSVLLPILLICLVPSAATLGLLFAGHRRLAACVAFMGTFPPAGLFLLLIAQLANSTASPFEQLLQVAIALPFLYTTVTLARIAFGVRVTAGEQRQARQLKAARRAAALTTGPTESR
jgi:hypothetical protein